MCAGNAAKENGHSENWEKFQTLELDATIGGVFESSQIRQSHLETQK